MHICFRMRISTKGTQQIQERVPREALPWTNNPHKKIKKQLVSTPMNFISQKIWDSWVSKNILLHDDPISFLRISLFRGDFVLFVIAFVLALEPATEGAIFINFCLCFFHLPVHVFLFHFQFQRVHVHQVWQPPILAGHFTMFCIHSYKWTNMTSLI